MSKVLLYDEIVESIRLAIVRGDFEVGEGLPTIREMAKSWNCAPGTVMRAYQMLAEEGVVVSRPGAGTHVAKGVGAIQKSPARTAELINQLGDFVFSKISSGFDILEIESAFQVSLDHYRAIPNSSDSIKKRKIRFAGSHDPIISLLGTKLKEISFRNIFEISFSGSLGGLIALAEGKADVAGAHLWDQETDTYNIPFVRRLLPGKTVALVNLVQRRVGLITASGNPLGVKKLADIARKNISFINRQSGAGTRVWLDAQLSQLGISPEKIFGYQDVALTHSDTAKIICEGSADVGLGIESAAKTFGLNFICLNTERYDLVIPQENWDEEIVQVLLGILKDKSLLDTIERFSGYDVCDIGKVEWVS